MPTPIRTPRQERREAIAEILATRRVHSQAELAEQLEQQGIEANQATLSRDLRDLAVVKGPAGYALPVGGERSEDPHGRLRLAAREWLLSVAAAQNQVLLKTPPGGAQPFALAIDGVELPGKLGTIAGDDTILVVAPDARRARQLAQSFEELVP